MTDITLAEDPFARAEEAAAAVTQRLGRTHRVAIVLGSGWAQAAAGLGETVAEVPMPTLPGFPEPRVLGHEGAMRSMDIEGVPTLLLAGRSHFYEGHPVPTVVHGVRTAVAHGCSTVVLTNAAGSLTTDFPVGSSVMISDHLNLTGQNPLTGPEPPERFGGRFCDLTSLYSPRLRAAVRDAMGEVGEGVYCGVLGGSFETPAEIRMYRTLGADLVGMSTVLEAIAARHMGAEVFGVSLVTNLAAGLAGELSHQEVLEAGRDAADSVARLMRTVVAACA